METLHLPSLVLGFLSVFTASGIFVGVMCAIGLRRAVKERERALDQVLAEVAIRCIERPTNVKVN